MVRENVLPAIGKAEETIDRFEGGSAELLQEIMTGWWERVGNTKLSGITKLMMAEAGNFPEVAKFYHDEVICRGNAMVARVLERGIARGEFRPIDTVQAVSIMIAPMLMLTMWKHSFCACGVEPISPQDYLSCYSDLLLHGLLKPAPAP